MKSDSIFRTMLCVMILVTSNSCKKLEIEFPDPSTLPKGLVGSWVESSKGLDTIDFNSNNDTGSFYLHRVEIKDIYPFHFEITLDSIYIIDVLSGTYMGRNYYFNFNEPNLTINIGKFCKYIDVKKSILTFRKIK